MLKHGSYTATNLRKASVWKTVNLNGMLFNHQCHDITQHWVGAILEEEEANTLQRTLTALLTIIGYWEISRRYSTFVFVFGGKVDFEYIFLKSHIF